MKSQLKQHSFIDLLVPCSWWHENFTMDLHLTDSQAKEHSASVPLRRVLVSLLAPVQPLSCRPIPEHCFSHKDPFRTLQGERATPTRSVPNPVETERSQVGMAFTCLKALKCLVLHRLGALPPFFWLVKQKTQLQVTQFDIQKINKY